VNTLTNRIGLPATGQQGILSNSHYYALFATVAAGVWLAVLGIQIKTYFPAGLSGAPTWVHMHVLAAVVVLAYGPARLAFGVGASKRVAK
jgi:hypothetical protein